MLLIGFALPGDYRFREPSLSRDAEAIHECCRPESIPEWTPGSLVDPTLVYTYEGEPGVGFRSRWTGEKAGKGTLEITSAEPGRGIVYVMKFEGFPPMDGVTISAPTRWNHGDLKMSGTMDPPLGGWLSMTMDPALGADIENGLTKNFTPEIPKPAPRPELLVPLIELASVRPGWLVGVIHGSIDDLRNGELDDPRFDPGMLVRIR